MPLVGGAQWIVGTTLALVIARRSRVFGGAGGAPRRIAWLAVLIFIIAGIAVLVSLIAERRADSALVLPAHATSAWRVRTVEILSIVGWMLGTVAALWNGVLGGEERLVRVVRAGQRADETGRGVGQGHGRSLGDSGGGAGAGRAGDRVISRRPRPASCRPACGSRPACLPRRAGGATG